MDGPAPELDYLHSGSTLLNLALTGDPNKGWPMGLIGNIVGDNSTGKTLLATEVAKSVQQMPPKGTNPKIWYVETEGAYDNSYAQSLGLDTDSVKFESIDTIEKFFTLVSKCCEETNPKDGGLIILDSLDALSSASELDTDIDKGSYNMSRQKKLSEFFRRLAVVIKGANIHLMIISQVRSNITTTPFAPKFVRTGGKALDFYCSHIVWLTNKSKLVDSKEDIQYGVSIQAEVKKNKTSSPFRKALFPVVFGIGVDNTRSIVEFLVEKKVIHKLPAGWYTLEKDSDKKFRLEDLIKYVESDVAVYRDLIQKTEKEWKRIESSVLPERKDKFAMLAAASQDLVVTNTDNGTALSESDPELSESKPVEKKRGRKKSE